eukprot:9106072-Alexandrium_andersonii.AAC.1
MSFAQMPTLGKPGGSLARGARSGRHDVEALPAVGNLAISYVTHRCACPYRLRKTRPDLAGQTRHRQDRPAADSGPSGCNRESPTP